MAMSGRTNTARRRRGFTLLELMVAVAIIGILASTAITSFLRYQWRSKRSEAYANLESIRKVEISYQSEFGSYVSAVPSPAVAVPSEMKQNWPPRGYFDAVPGGGFEQVGWAPEGPTFFDYEVVAMPDVGAGPYFTARAFGDVDGDGFLSVFMYVVPDGGGLTAACALCGPATDPINSGGAPLYSTVAPAVGGDDF